ncbi:MAG TPA: hypothetical protein VKP04_04010 [Ktedonobacteraceae bacterium]|nr:hypothetical protein [Ktedonobacteraceae bacterium]
MQQPWVFATKVLTNIDIEAYAELSIDNIHSVKGYVLIHWLSSTPSNEAGDS